MLEAKDNLAVAQAPPACHRPNFHPSNVIWAGEACKVVIQRRNHIKEKQAVWLVRHWQPDGGIDPAYFSISVCC